MDKKELVRLAFEAREHTYSPYSNYGVGAALLTESGKVFQGCNIENASYGASICAERTAAVQAVYEGERVFKAIAIVGSLKGSDPAKSDYAYPCGICRQFLVEYAAPDMKVYVAKTPEDILETTMKEILPYAFSPSNLNT